MLSWNTLGSILGMDSVLLIPYIGSDLVFEKLSVRR